MSSAPSLFFKALALVLLVAAAMPSSAQTDQELLKAQADRKRLQSEMEKFTKRLSSGYAAALRRNSFCVRLGHLSAEFVDARHRNVSKVEASRFVNGPDEFSRQMQALILDFSYSTERDSFDTNVDVTYACSKTRVGDL